MNTKKAMLRKAAAFISALTFLSVSSMGSFSAMAAADSTSSSASNKKSTNGTSVTGTTVAASSTTTATTVTTAMPATTTSTPVFSGTTTSTTTTSTTTTTTTTTAVVSAPSASTAATAPVSSNVSAPATSATTTSTTTTTTTVPKSTQIIKITPTVAEKIKDNLEADLKDKVSDSCSVKYKDSDKSLIITYPVPDSVKFEDCLLKFEYENSKDDKKVLEIYGFKKNDSAYEVEKEVYHRVSGKTDCINKEKVTVKERKFPDGEKTVTYSYIEENTVLTGADFNLDEGYHAAGSLKVVSEITIDNNGVYCNEKDPKIKFEESTFSFSFVEIDAEVKLYENDDADPVEKDENGKYTVKWNDIDKYCIKVESRNGTDRFKINNSADQKTNNAFSDDSMPVKELIKEVMEKRNEKNKHDAEYIFKVIGEHSKIGGKIDYIGTEHTETQDYLLENSKYYIDLVKGGPDGTYYLSGYKYAYSADDPQKGNRNVISGGFDEYKDVVKYIIDNSNSYIEIYSNDSSAGLTALESGKYLELEYKKVEYEKLDGFSDALWVFNKCRSSSDDLRTETDSKTKESIIVSPPGKAFRIDLEEKYADCELHFAITSKKGEKMTGRTYTDKVGIFGLGSYISEDISYITFNIINKYIYTYLGDGWKECSRKLRDPENVPPDDYEDTNYQYISEEVTDIKEIEKDFLYEEEVTRTERNKYYERKIKCSRTRKTVPVPMRPFMIVFDDTKPVAWSENVKNEWQKEAVFDLKVDESFGCAAADDLNIDKINNVGSIIINDVVIKKETDKWDFENPYMGKGTAQIGNPTHKVDYTVKVKPVKQDGGSYFKVNISVDGEDGEFITDDFKVCVADCFGNKSDPFYVGTNIEKSAPKVSSITLSDITNEICKDQLAIKASVTEKYNDFSDYSGIAGMDVYFCKDKKIDSRSLKISANTQEDLNKKTEKAVFSGNLDLKDFIEKNDAYSGYLILVVEDKAGNKKEYYYSSEKTGKVSNLSKDATPIKLDSKAPDIPKVELIGGKGKNNNWFLSSPVVRITAKDDDERNTGISKLYIRLTNNGSNINEFDIDLSALTCDEIGFNAEEELKKGNFKIVFSPVDENGNPSPKNEFSDNYLYAVPKIEIDGYTLKNDPLAGQKVQIPDEDSHFSIRVQAQDGGDNKSDEESKRIDFDLTSPEIVGFEFENEKPDEKVKTDSPAYRSKYSNFIKSDMTVKIFVSDEGHSSGLQTVDVKLVDADNNEMEPSNYKEHFDSKYVEIEIPSEFKGDIIANVYDIVGHSSGEWASNGVISDTPENHKNKAKIEIELPNTDHRDRSGRQLYAGDIEAEVTVSDPQSGIRKIKWSHDDQEDTSRFNDESVKDRSFDGWEFGDNIERTIVTKASRKINISNEGNGKKLYVEMSDNARNVPVYAEENFSIDKTKPEIILEGIEKSDEIEYYNMPQTAYITVTDTNWQFPVITGENVPEFEHNKDDEKDTEVKGKIEFTDDGRYSLEVNDTDLAGNIAEPKSTGTFVIDTVDPKASIHVRRIGGNDLNTGEDVYISADAEVVVEVEELNLDTSDVNVTVNGNAVNSEKWIESGAAHTLLIPRSYFANDGKYVISVSGKDRADNSMKAVTAAFNVDRKKPDISIGGILAANNGEVAPVVNVNEANPASQSVILFRNDEQLKSNVEENGSVVRYSVQDGGYITGRWQKSGSDNTGSKMVFDNFPSEKEYDGIYKIAVDVQDKAENASQKEKTFSVNRFGSVFTIENRDEIDGCHLSKAPDIRIIERNVDMHSKNDEVIIIVDKGSDIVRLTKDQYTVSKPVELSDRSGYEYTYDIDPQVFDQDLDYKVSVQTVDAAGNKNVSSLRDADISFSIDTHVPDFICDDLVDQAEFRQSERQFRLNVNEKLKHIRVTTSLNETLLNAAGRSDGENSYVFIIPASNAARDLTVELIDLAGNKNIKTIKNLLVTENIVLYAMHKTWAKAVAASAAAVGFGAAGGAVLLRRRKKKRY